MLNLLKNIGKLEPFEIRNTRMFFALAGISIYFYVMAMLHFNPKLNIPYYGQEFFSTLFLALGLLPYTKNKLFLEYYGWISFIALILLQYYLTYVTALNDYSLDYLLITYVFTYGAILLLNNKLFVVLFSLVQLLHISYRVFNSNLDTVSISAILLSMGAIFIFSFLVMNGFIRYRKNLKAINADLEKKVKARTLDLEKRAKELVSKNKDLESFAYVVSHDLKRPLRNIHTLTDWLTEDTANLNDGVTNNLQLIKEQVTQMDLLVDGILDYSLQMKASENHKIVEVQKLVERLVAVNSIKNCDITIEKGLPNVNYNEPQLLQVFQNLVQNAIKYNDKDKTCISISCKENNSHYVFSVSDNGPGINERYHDKIFKLFQRLESDPKEGSIGIGLALVKKIIEKNGGEIWLKSKLEEGATFFFSILK